MNIKGVEYVIGQDRNEPDVVAHLYAGTFHKPGDPMCVRGWNRSSGDSYSIFRGTATGGLCKVCLRRAIQGKEPVKSRYRETKWI